MWRVKSDGMPGTVSAAGCPCICSTGSWNIDADALAYPGPACGCSCDYGCENECANCDMAYDFIAQ